MRPSHEFSVELTAQDLLNPPELKSAAAVITEVDLAAMAAALIAPPSSALAQDGEIEIELTAEEIDVLLGATSR